MRILEIKRLSCNYMILEYLIQIRLTCFKPSCAWHTHAQLFPFGRCYLVSDFVTNSARVRLFHNNNQKHLSLPSAAGNFAVATHMGPVWARRLPVSPGSVSDTCAIIVQTHSVHSFKRVYVSRVVEPLDSRTGCSEKRMVLFHAERLMSFVVDGNLKQWR